MKQIPQNSDTRQRNCFMYKLSRLILSEYIFLECVCFHLQMMVKKNWEEILHKKDGHDHKKFKKEPKEVLRFQIPL